MAETTIDWYRTTIPKENPEAAYTEERPGGWIQSGSFLLVCAVLTDAAVYFFWQRWWIPIVLACYVHAVFVNMMSISAAVHKLSHGTPFRTNPVNEFWADCVPPSIHALRPCKLLSASRVRVPARREATAPATSLGSPRLDQGYHKQKLS